MARIECVAMILAGGQGSRLGVLTNEVAKPAVPFGGKYRIIDFPLTNCSHSGISTVGVLTQYQPLDLNTYIGNGGPWDLDRNNGGVYVLPPYVSMSENKWYKGTANAIYHNIQFIEKFNPKYVLVLSGDHIYKMDYRKMIDFHKEKEATATIAVMSVPWEEASRFGIMDADEDGKIIEFHEKPENPISNQASMGIYIFDWENLKIVLEEDEKDENSSKDFGKDIIPKMLSNKMPMYAYRFQGYWKDVGTVHSLWEANMDIIADPPLFNLNDSNWRIYSRNPIKPPHYISNDAVITNSCVTEGCNIFGDVDHCVISDGVTIEKGAKVRDSVIFPNVHISSDAVLEKVVVGEGTVIGKGAEIGLESKDDNPYASHLCTNDIVLINGNIKIPDGAKIYKNSMVRTFDIGGGDRT
ncbi:MAG: glucose-1-phosphate adenylyltransferase [Clostridiales bacterium]|mgnify:FL=1|nr:glucose-1-phosphate adenylyltransferase [Clostridiales bacterium]